MPGQRQGLPAMHAIVWIARPPSALPSWTIPTTLHVRNWEQPGREISPSCLGPCQVVKPGLCCEFRLLPSNHRCALPWCLGTRAHDWFPDNACCACSAPADLCQAACCSSVRFPSMGTSSASGSGRMRQIVPCCELSHGTFAKSRTSQIANSFTGLNTSGQ